MTRRNPLDRPIRVLGLLAATVVGWALLAPLPYLASVANDLWWSPSWARAIPFQWPSFGDIFTWGIFFAMFGLPLAAIFCFLFGYPAWAIASWLGWKRRRDAAFVGAILGFGLGAAIAAVSLIGSLSTAPMTMLIFYYPGLVLYVVGVGAVAGLAAWWASGARVSGHRDVEQVFA